LFDKEDEIKGEKK